MLTTKSLDPSGEKPAEKPAVIPLTAAALAAALAEPLATAALGRIDPSVLGALELARPTLQGPAWSWAAMIELVVPLAITVLVVQNGHAERRAVTVSNARLDEVVISAGVAAGERVIVDWPPGLTDGSAVAEKR